MSRLHKLIIEECSTGVPFRQLGSVIKLNFGTRITKLQDTGTLYPVYGGGGESFRTDSFNREDEYVISRFAMSEKCVRKVQGKFWMLDSGFTFDPIDDSVDKNFIAHLLFSMQREIYACSSEGAQKNLRTDQFKSFLLPIPPIGVQRELVSVLDQLQRSQEDLALELTAEIQARQRQYDFTRDFSLASIGGHKRALGEMGHFARGRRFTKSDVVDSGIPAIHYGEIYTHYGVATSYTLSQVRPELSDQLSFAQPGDVVIATVGETVEDVAKAVAWLGDVPVAIHDDTCLYRSNLNPKYVSYAMQTADFHAQKNKHVARAKVKRISSVGLSKIAIPVPPRDKQDRIVGLLDEFNTAMKGLSLELSAELKARRQQYEHYRKRILTFKEAA